MEDFLEKERSQQWFYQLERRIFYMWCVLAFSVLVIGLVRGGVGFENYLELQKREETLKARVDEIAGEADRLAAEIDKIKTTPNYARQLYEERYTFTHEM